MIPPSGQEISNTSIYRPTDADISVKGLVAERIERFRDILEIKNGKEIVSQPTRNFGVGSNLSTHHNTFSHHQGLPVFKWQAMRTRSLVVEPS